MERIRLSHARWGRLLAGALFLTLFASCSLPGEAEAQLFPFGRAQRRYEDCVELCNGKHFEQARDCIREFISLYPNSRWVEHLQFLDAKMETDVKEAQEKLQRFLMDYPNGPYSGEANFNLAEISELDGDYTNAEKYYGRVYRYFPTSRLRREAGIRTGNCMLLAGNTESAIDHLEAYLSIHREQPWHSRARTIYADALYEYGEYDEAQQEYKMVLSQAASPAEGSVHCYLQIGKIYEHDGNYEAAYRTYKQCLHTFPNAIQKPRIEDRLARLAGRLNMDPSARSRPHIIEAGICKSDQDAMNLVARLKRLGYQAYVVNRNSDYPASLSVRLGPFESRDSALAVADRLSKEAGLTVTLLPQNGYL